MGTVYEYAPEVDEILKKLNKQYDLNLDSFSVSCVFSNQFITGKSPWAKIKKVSSLFKFLTGIDLVLIVVKPLWQQLSEKQKEALVLHELLHCVVKVDSEGNKVVSLCRHDLEEFAQVVEHYGLWNKGLEKFCKSIESAQQGCRKDRSNLLCDEATYESLERSRKRRMGNG